MCSDENRYLFFQCRFFTPNSLAVGDIIESKTAMFIAFKKVLLTILTLWVPNCPNTLNVKWSSSISWQRQSLSWLFSIMPVSAVTSTADLENSDNSDSGEGHEENDKGIWSLSMKWIIAFTMKSTWQLPFRLMRRPQYLQWQQQVRQKMIPWWIQCSKNFLNPTIKPTKTGENRHLRR